MIARTPLHEWVSVGLGAPLTPDTLARRQRDALRQSLSLAMQSPFYRERLAGFDPEALKLPADLAKLPLTSQEELRERALDFLRVSQAEIARTVTLESSGTSGSAKRLFFTAADLESTVEFFRYGMAAFTGPGDRVLVLMPGRRPGGVGDLLLRALARFGARGTLHDLSLSVEATLERIAEGGFTVLVCLPVQALALARAARRLDLPRLVREVLVSAEYAAPSLVQAVEDGLCERVFNHWGMTETGLGGAVECAARRGLHLRELDLFVEIVDPLTGAPLPEGELGEIVVTTLRREGMPLLRYRTGDLARLLPGVCPCGGLLRRLDGLAGRLADRAPLPGGALLSLAELDQALFALPGVVDFTATLTRRGRQASLALGARLDHDSPRVRQAVSEAAQALAAAKDASLRLALSFEKAEEPVLARTGKRRLNLVEEVAA